MIMTRNGVSPGKQKGSEWAWELTGTGGDSQRGASRENPPKSFGFALAVTVERHGDLVVQFLNRCIDRSLLLTSGHLVVVKHALDIVLHSGELLVKTLRQNVDFMLHLASGSTLPLDLGVPGGLE